jgi:hypothetical protein
MRVGFCWRCKKDVPTLDDNEFEQITTLLSAADQELPEYREAFNIPDGDVTVDELLRPVFDVYEKMTGVRTSNTSEIMHHRLSLYGPPCSSCGKLLRTPQAAKCLMCGKAKE